ncbi:hypothetical protein GCK72_000605 [Caenorhabditis remanei]|uniref:Uncharacterized protein n=1 Tax=Caenorhabditis remanei TaxID=31234 RepID=A0A6A5HSP7_CAERE|nr:hypothetical protein GCK72_000605 [Caenorhabditis remanei]KAF1768792.1 hypothetical protein GCK72_000605 [Caenorhabditis remanei]
MVTFILLAASCTSKPKESHKNPTGGRKLTMSTMSTPSTSFNTISDFSFDEKLEEEEEKKEEGNELEEKKEPELKEEEKREFSCGKDEKEEEKGDKGGKAENKETEFNLETSPAFTICIDNKSDVRNDVFILNARKSLDESAGFQWTIKKRLAFDDGSWKQLNRRIAALKAEGLDTCANTKQAKDNKNNCIEPTKMDAHFEKQAAAKPKKKAVE